MKELRVLLYIGLFFVFIGSLWAQETVEVDAQTSIKNFAPKPPLGFNSFDSYLSSLNESAAYALMDVMAEKYHIQR